MAAIPRSVIAFRELSFEGSATSLQTFFERLLAFGSLVDWTRNKEKERSANEVPLTQSRYYCYDFAGAGDLPAATVWVAQEGESARVINILSADASDLGPRSYNQVLGLFEAAVVELALAEVGVKVCGTKAEQGLDDLLKAPEAARLFREFVATANASTGTLHPLDGARFSKFVISAYWNNLHPDTSLLGRWVKLNYQWPEYVIDRTMAKLEDELALLREHEELRPRYAQAA